MLRRLVVVVVDVAVAVAVDVVLVDDDGGSVSLCSAMIANGDNVALLHLVLLLHLLMLYLRLQ